MDITITSNRICAGMPGHKLCLDYQLPAVQKIVARFLKQHPLIPAYKDCHFSKNSLGSIATITCFERSYHVSAEEQKIPGFFDPSSTNPSLTISLSKDGMGKFEALECDKNGCKASIYSGPSILFQYSFHHFPGGSVQKFFIKAIHAKVITSHAMEGQFVLKNT